MHNLHSLRELEAGKFGFLNPVRRAFNKSSPSHTVAELISSALFLKYPSQPLCMLCMGPRRQYAPFSVPLKFKLFTNIM